MMKRRNFLTLLGGAAAWPLAARAPAQQVASKVWRVGMLDSVSREQNAANIAAFEKGLRDLGYISGHNLIIEDRSSDGHNERVHDLASDLVRLNVDVIVLRGTPQAYAAKNATGTIPVVMAAVADPVGSGIVGGLAHPGGNITGLGTFYTELQAKRVELLKEMVPGIKRMATLVNLSNPATATQWEEVQRAARILGIEVRRLDVRSIADVTRVFEMAINEGIEALSVAIDTQTYRRQIIECSAPLCCYTRPPNSARPCRSRSVVVRRVLVCDAIHDSAGKSNAIYHLREPPVVYQLGERALA
jgi:putative ABC transport system substrate-binding protein